MMDSCYGGIQKQIIWGTFEHFRDIETSNHVTGLTILFLHFSPQLTNTPANFVLLSSGKKTDFTDRKAYLPLMSGKMANFTDRMIYLFLSSGKMTGFTDRMGLLPLLSGETANFTDGEGIWSMLSGKMTDFTDRCKTTGILR